jgi:O-antigen ligase
VKGTSGSGSSMINCFQYKINTFKSSQMKNQISKKEVHLPQGIIWFYTLVSLVVIPLFYYKNAVDQTLVPKLAFLSGLLILYILIFVISKKVRVPIENLLKFKPVWFWAGFTLMTLISLFVAVNPSAGTTDAVRTFTLLVFLLITTGLLIRYNNVRYFIIPIMVLSLIYSCIGFYQYFTFVFRSVDLESLYRINGVMSHKNIFTLTLFLTTPFLLYRLMVAKKSEGILALILLFLSISVQLLVQTRSVWLALSVFITVSVVLFLKEKKQLSGQKKLMVSRVWWSLAVFISAFIFSFLLNQYSWKHPKVAETSLVKEKIENLGKRATSIFDSKSPNRIKRVDIWSRTVEIIGDHPVLGVGAGNWKVNIPAYSKPEMNENFYHNWDRPHNDFLWVFSEKGIVGIGVYLAFFISLILLAFRFLRKKTADYDHIVLMIFMLAGIAGYCTDACFSFPYERIETQIMMLMMASVILWISAECAQKQLKNGTRSSGVRVWIAGGVMLVAGLIICMQMIRSERYINYAHEALITKQWPTVVQAIDLAECPWSNLDPVNNPYRWYSGNAKLEMGDFEGAKADFARALSYSPNSVNTLCDMGIAYCLQKDYPKAIEYLSKGEKIYPLNRGMLRYKGQAYLGLGEYKKSLDCFYRCLTDKPNPQLDTLIAQTERKLYGNQE